MPNNIKEWSDTKKWVMGILSTIVVAVVLTFLINPIRDLMLSYKTKKMVPTVIITSTIKSFDMVAEIVGSAQLVTSTSYQVDAIDKLVQESFWPKLRAIIIPAENPDKKPLNLNILKGKLYADQPLIAFFPWRYETPAQSSGPRRELNIDSPVDLAEVFELTRNPNGHSQGDLKVYLTHKSNQYHQLHVVISNKSEYTFQPNSKKSLSAELRRMPIRILITDTKSAGIQSSLTDALLVHFRNILTEIVNNDDSIQLVGFTLEELMKKREELKSVEWSPGKTDVIEDFAVNFIIEPTMLFKQNNL